jgi:sucrose-6-phosphate hydrolase SacC (GH32 family)
MKTGCTGRANGGRLATACALLVVGSTLNLPADQEDPSETIRKTEDWIRNARELREKFRRDPHRPRYHLVSPAGWMNDINGCLFWKGRYHIFYQYNSSAAYWKPSMQWGHASSADLVHWVYHPIALTPTPDGPDRAGCFSGGALISKDGKPTIIYHGHNAGTCIATSEDDLLIHWTKHPANPVIPIPKPGEPGHDKYIVFDPCAWREGDSYGALIGNRVPNRPGDATSLFRSTDLVHWEYAGPFYEWNPRGTDPHEDCAVPDFFPLGRKHVLLFCSHLRATQYYIGRYEGDRFHPETHEMMSWPGGHLNGPRTLLDGQGRRLFFDWIAEAREVEAQRASGWSGVVTLPRVLSLSEDDTLRIEPAPEVEKCRYNPRSYVNPPLPADSELRLETIRGDCLELALEIEPGDARQFGVKVRCSPDRVEQTAVVCDPGAKTLSVDMGQSTLNERITYWHYRGFQPSREEELSREEQRVTVQSAPFALKPGEPLRLRIFLDRSVLEVFANGRQCITQRIYPTRPDSLDVVLFAHGGRVKVKSVTAWDMAPTNDS